MSKPDLEALVTPRIAESVQAAVDKVGRSDFEAITGVDDKRLASILNADENYLAVAIVTLACQINKNHNDPDPAHSSVTECLKGSTIRIPPVPGHAQPATAQASAGRRRLQKLNSGTTAAGPLIDAKSTRILGFMANIVSFLIVGYFLGGIGISPLMGESSCIGITASPLGLAPCGGSYVGIIVSAIGGIGYTFYYFVKRL